MFPILIVFLTFFIFENHESNANNDIEANDVY